jgi:hypothetical protein
MPTLNSATMPDLSFAQHLWGMVSNHHMLRWLATVVVSDVEKASVRRQVGIRETTAA